LIFPLKIVIFHSYVSLPEGNDPISIVDGDYGIGDYGIGFPTMFFRRPDGGHRGMFVGVRSFTAGHISANALE